MSENAKDDSFFVFVFHFKHEFGCEEFDIFCITNISFRTTYSKLRVGFLNLACYEGLYSDRPFDERLRLPC